MKTLFNRGAAAIRLPVSSSPRLADLIVRTRNELWMLRERQQAVYALHVEGVELAAAPEIDLAALGNQIRVVCRRLEALEELERGQYVFAFAEPVSISETN